MSLCPCVISFLDSWLCLTTLEPCFQLTCRHFLKPAVHGVWSRQASQAFYQLWCSYMFVSERWHRDRDASSPGDSLQFIQLFFTYNYWLPPHLHCTWAWIKPPGSETPRALLKRLFPASLMGLVSSLLNCKMTPSSKFAVGPPNTGEYELNLKKEGREAIVWFPFSFCPFLSPSTQWLWGPSSVYFSRSGSFFHFHQIKMVRNYVLDTCMCSRSWPVLGKDRCIFFKLHHYHHHHIFATHHIVIIFINNYS